MLKQFPQCFGVVPDVDNLTETQWRWLGCQYFLDDGGLACPHCDALTAGPYCRACGGRVTPELSTCEQCAMEGSGAYCQYCGTALRTTVADAIASQTFDWEAWLHSLTPFLGGLTPQEQALLSGER